MTIQFNPDLTGVETPEQHMDACIDAFSKAWREKYMNGQREHGGMLWRKSTLPFLQEEVLDFVSYVAVLGPQLKRVEELLESAYVEAADFNNAAAHEIRKALNILQVGNEDGAPEEEL